LFPHLFAMKWWDQMSLSWFFECCFNPDFSLSSLTFIKMFFSSSSLSAIRMVLSAYLFSSVAQSCTTLCDPMDCTMPGLPVHQPTLGAHSNSCPSSWWCHPTISSSVIPFSSCLQSFPASESFQMSQLFTSGGQSIGVSASTSVLPMNTQDWSPLGWTGWMSSQGPKDSQESSPTAQFKRWRLCYI